MTAGGCFFHTQKPRNVTLGVASRIALLQAVETILELDAGG